MIDKLDELQYVETANIKEFQLSMVCHACGTANTVTLCPGCGRLVNIVHKYCYNCGLVLETPDRREMPARDMINLDYGGESLVAETKTIMAYLAAMVYKVMDRSENETTRPKRFVFMMSPAMWEAISGLYVRAIMPDTFMELNQAQLTVKQSILVNGIEYPVVLDEGRGDSIIFSPLIEEGPYANFFTAILRNVGVG